MKIEKIIFFLGRLYNDLTADYEEEKAEQEKIQQGVKDYKAAKELSAREKANYIVAQNLEAGCSAYLQRNKNARDSIEMLIKPGASIPAYVRDLLEQYYRESKKAAYISGEVDTKNVVSVQLSQIEGRLKEAGYAIFGGPETLRKIEEEKILRKLRRLKKTDPAAAEDHTDPAPQKMVDSNAHAGDAPAGDAKENTADPAQTGGTPAGAKEDTADSAAQAEGIPADAKENTADPTAKADEQEKPNEDAFLHVIGVIIFG